MKNLLLIIALLFSTAVGGQQTADWPGAYFQGYAQTLHGGGFQYHSPQPDATQSMLVRSMDSLQYVEWKTEIVPENIDRGNVNFVWIYGIDANPDSHSYYLFLNGERLLKFTNPLVSEKKTTIIAGIKGITLTFRPTMIDKYGDPMGYAVLSVPAVLVIKGKPQLIRVSGETAGSRSWYMTFEAGVEEKTDITQSEAVLKGEKGNMFSILFHFVHLGEPADGRIRIVPGIDRKFRLETGYTRVEIRVPETSSEVKKSAEIRIQGKPVQTLDFTLKPVRPWTIYLVQHTHTDIGYTRPQTEILPEHLRYIDYALDYCDQTDSLPDDARFRWTCETSWAVREYLKCRPQEQIERLKKRVNEGRIEVAGLLLNGSDLSDEATIAAMLQPVRMFREQGLKVVSAMQDDINGAPWCLTDYFSGCGIRYLTMAENTHRAHKPFDRPTTFWWESPSGNRILVNRPEHYMWANQLGILTNEETFAKNLFTHLSDIVAKGYPYPEYAIQFSGYLTDNSPPSTAACALVKAWNEKYLYPKLRLATVREFMELMEKDHAKELQVVRGAWPDWWMDGFGSAALETAYTRMAHADYIANNGLLSMAVMKGIQIPEALEQLNDGIVDDLAFYDEHTFGAAESITDPFCENSIVQWGEKGSYTWEAVKRNRILREGAMGLIQGGLPRFDVPSITVFNTLSWIRSGLITVFIDHEIIPRDMEFRIVDEQGNPLAVQPLGSREDGTYWAIWVDDIPAFGYSSFRILAGKEPRRPATSTLFKGTISNSYYEVSIDPSKGGIVSIRDKELNLELLDQSAKYSAGEFIWERLGKNRHQLELLTLEEFTREVWSSLVVSSVTEGPVWTAVTLTGQMPGCVHEGGITCEIRLFNTSKKIGFNYSMKKLQVTDPEAVYIPFPFGLDNAEFHCEVAGGSMVPGRDQIEGSSSDWRGIQNFVSLKNDHAQIIMTSPEIPLVQLGDINLGKFARVAKPTSSTVYSWVLNNYWTTNFRAYQEGELKWSYGITSTNSLTTAAPAKFGWTERVPLLCRVFPAASEQRGEPSAFLLGAGLRHLLLVNATPGPEEGTVILHLRETDGNGISVSISGLIRSTAAREVWEVNVLGEKIRRVAEALEVRPLSTVFLMLQY
jgi:alpha-mannosidase